MSAILLPTAGATDPACNKKCASDAECAVKGSTCTWCLADQSGVQRCTTEPTRCGGGPPLAAKTSFPQYFIVGDSVSHGYSTVGGLVELMLKKGFEAVPMIGGGGGEAGETSRGFKCLPEWVGQNKSRFNVVSWNFGLHDLARPFGKWDGPNAVPVAAYEEYLLNISRLFDRRMPVAKQLYVTTTPVPASTALSPPRKESDVLIYNTAAKKVMASLGVPVLDIWTLVDEACGGDPYTECPAGCAERSGGEIANCVQKKNNVHFEKQGYLKIANALAEAVEVLHSGGACSDLLKHISIGLCHSERIIVV